MGAMVIECKPSCRRTTVTVQALYFGDPSIAAIPCETFVEIGLKLKAFRGGAGFGFNRA